jgi:limonene-1,2-epoxide hydrolase
LSFVEILHKLQRLDVLLKLTDGKINLWRDYMNIKASPYSVN